MSTLSFILKPSFKRPGRRKQSFRAVILLLVSSGGAQSQSAEEVPHRIIDDLWYAGWPTAVICLKETEATDYMWPLRPRLSQYARLLAVPESNTLIASVPPDRMPELLATVAATEIYQMPFSDAVKRLPAMHADSKEQPQPERPGKTGRTVEAQYTPAHLSPGRLMVYLQTFGDTPVGFSEDMTATVFYGEPVMVQAQTALAKMIDVETYQECIARAQP